MKFIPIIFATFLFFSGSSFAEQTAPYDVVTEFIQELADTNRCQNIAAAELADAKKLVGAERNQGVVKSMILNSTRIKLKLRTHILLLKDMSLQKPYEKLIPTIIFWHERKLSLWDEMGNAAKAFAGGLKGNVDYPKLAARSPEINAELENADKALFDLMPMVFITLIDRKPDSKDQVSHLTITKEQGQKLVATLNNHFGSSLDEKGQNMNWTIGTASVLRSYLTENGYKYADEPWE